MPRTTSKKIRTPQKRADRRAVKRELAQQANALSHPTPAVPPVAKATQPHTEAAENAELLMQMRAERHVGQNGILYERQYWWHADLKSWLGKRVLVYLHGNGQLYVFDQRSKFICAAERVVKKPYPCTATTCDRPQDETFRQAKPLERSLAEQQFRASIDAHRQMRKVVKTHGLPAPVSIDNGKDYEVTNADGLDAPLCVLLQVMRESLQGAKPNECNPVYRRQLLRLTADLQQKLDQLHTQLRTANQHASAIALDATGWAKYKATDAYNAGVAALNLIDGGLAPEPKGGN